MVILPYSSNVTVSLRKDGKKRYRLCLPKKLGDMKGIIEGKFIYNSERQFVNFIVEPRWKREETSSKEGLKNEYKRQKR